jgi:hypothetical protein
MSADLRLPHQLTGSDKTLKAACHCGGVRFTITIPTSALPLPVHLCHCSICRYTHGTFCCFHSVLPKGVQPEFVPPSSLESSLTGYVHSSKAKSERLFCTTCGCHIGDRDIVPDSDTGTPNWRVASSIFASHDEDTFQIRSHWFSGSAMEPNLATWLPSINSRPIHLFDPPTEDAPGLSGNRVQSGETSPITGDHNGEDDAAHHTDILPARCHCGGVSFAILPPSLAETKEPFLSRFLYPSPPILPPNLTSTGTDGDGEDENTSTFRRSLALKRPAGICLCRDCRLVSGAHAVPWMFVPLARLRPQGSPSVTMSEQQPQDTNDSFGLRRFGRTLRIYNSSDNVTRAFCGVCGATVFYVLDGPQRASSSGSTVDPVGDGTILVDVAAGILRDPSGSVAAEKWLVWQTGWCEGTESGREFDRGFVEGLERGLREWALKKYGRTVSFEIV